MRRFKGQVEEIIDCAGRRNAFGKLRWVEGVDEVTLVKSEIF